MADMANAKHLASLHAKLLVVLPISSAQNRQIDKNVRLPLNWIFSWAAIFYALINDLFKSNGHTGEAPKHAHEIRVRLNVEVMNNILF